jgi:hypothetical protein
MSWSFSHRSKDKVKLQDACKASFADSVKYCGATPEEGEKITAPVLAILLAAIDAAIIPPSASYLEVTTSGHADSGQRYFSVKVEPVYLPKTLD